MAAQLRASNVSIRLLQGVHESADLLCAAVVQGIIINMGSVAAVEPMQQACACESLRPPGFAGRY